MTASDNAMRTGSARADNTETHEAIVAGAGSAGLSAAAALQKRGFETLVLESSGAVGALPPPRTRSTKKASPASPSSTTGRPAYARDT